MTNQRPLFSFTLALLLAAAALALLAAAALAAPPPRFAQVPEDGKEGSAAGRLDQPVAIAADPQLPGHVYVADRGNKRIDEFTAWGEFVKAWGWDVNQEAPEEKLQTCTALNGCRAGSHGGGAGQLSNSEALAVDGSGGVYLLDGVQHRLQKFGPAGNFLLAYGRDVVASGPDNSNNHEVQEIKIAAAGGTFALSLERGASEAFGRASFSFASTEATVTEFTGAFIGDVISGDGIAPRTRITSVEELSAGELKLTLSIPTEAAGTNVQVTAVQQTPPLPYDASAAEVKAALQALPAIGGAGGALTVSGGPGDANGTSPYQVTFEGSLSGDDVPQLELDAGTLAQSVGAELKCSTTTSAPSISYRWLRNGAPIAGAGEATYTTTSADEGKAIQCEVIAANAVSGVIGASMPALLVAPYPASDPPRDAAGYSGLSGPGALVVGGPGGQKLRCFANPSDWTGSPSFSYSWYRNGAQIAGAGESTYTLTAADLATPAGFQCAVTGTNAAGGTTYVSESGITTAPAPEPLLNEAPQVSLSPPTPSAAQTAQQGGGPEICRAGTGDVCKAGVLGTGQGEFGLNGGYRSHLTASPLTGTVFVGEGERIQAFESNGAFKEEIQMPAGKKVRALAADSAGNLYVAFEGEAQVRKLKPAGPAAQFLAVEFKPEEAGESPQALALDGQGHLYVAESAHGEQPERVQEYDPAGNCLTCGAGGESEEVEKEKGKKTTLSGGFDRSRGAHLEALAASSACGPDAAYVAHFSPGAPESFFRSFGQAPNPALCEPPKAPPSIDDQYASTVEASEATLKAKINPHFWSGSVGTTTYWLQYATEACFEAGEWAASCVEATPQTTLPGVSVGEGVAVSVRLEGLAPATVYRYRFTAEGTGEAGEVLGVGGKPGSPGKDATFATFHTAAAQPPCPANEAFRSGPSAALPDCRAYEMVSPIDKEGADVITLAEFNTALPAVLSQSASSGDRLAYGASRAFAGAESSPWTAQYIATRHPGQSWVTHPISPPRGKNIFNAAVHGFDTEFRRFSPDLCHAWFQNYAEMPVGPPAPAGIADIYRRTDDECGGPTYVPQNTETPPVAEGGQFEVELQGVSEDESTAVFIANDKLAEGGTPGVYEGPIQGVLPFQAYAARGGQERFLCVLPGGGDWTGPCSVGGATSSERRVGRDTNIAGALSADGDKVYWSDHYGAEGKLYLRENPFGEGEECAEAASPCTLEVSRAAEVEAGTSASQFWAAANDGSTALFTTAGKLYEYRAGDESTHLIAAEVLGLLGQSKDASRVYLVSREARGTVNAEGKSATPGANNLYLHEGGTFRFIGALSSADMGELSPAALKPVGHTARVSADGESVAFMSTAPLSGYDNTDASTGEADAEVFLYRAGANEGQGKLVCASCDPSGARPRGALDVEGNGAYHIRAAAKISVPQNTFYPGRELAEDGRRLFFEGYGPLTPRDTNGQKDVYQWEAPGEGNCSPASSDYSSLDQGCVSLISSGKSPHESSFLDASPEGEDVFITTLSSLLPQDPGLVDVYDAREGGGLPVPQGLPASCEGEACQSPPEAPNDPTPASSSFEGAGNVHEEAKAKKKKKAKKHSKRKQVKKHQRRNGRSPR